LYGNCGARKPVVVLYAYFANYTPLGDYKLQTANLAQSSETHFLVSGSKSLIAEKTEPISVQFNIIKVNYITIYNMLGYKIDGYF